MAPVPDATAERRAAIDIGTVSTRLLVADVAGRSVDEVIRRTEITHLGEGVAHTGRLSDEALARTVEAASRFRKEAVSAGSTSLVAVATSAARDAANGADLIRALSGVGVEPSIITGPREARLAFAGATYSIRNEDVLVVDLGGGSTELILGSVREDDEGVVDVEVEASRSFDVGSRRVTDLHLVSDPPSETELDAAIAWICEQVRPFFDGLDRKPRAMVALGGSATSLYAVRCGMAVYDSEKVHGSTLSGADLADLREELSALTVEERRAVDGLDPARAGVIVGGVLVLETLLGLAGLEELVVSEHDMLYGLVLEV